jgi:Family of unknown function (DUF6589)
MAAANTLWRIYIEPKSLHDNHCGAYQCISSLFPKDTAKLTSDSVPFRMIHNGILHTSTANILDCWVIASGTNDIQTFITQEPSWEQICGLATKIVNTYIADDHLEEIRQHKKPEEHDYTFENQLIFN